VQSMTNNNFEVADCALSARVGISAVSTVRLTHIYVFGYSLHPLNDNPVDTNFVVG
jgi:hypothetical protein